MFKIKHLHYFILQVVLFSLISSNLCAQNSLTTNGIGPKWVALGDLDVTGSQVTVEAMVRRQNASNQGNIVSKHHSGPADVNYLLRLAGFLITTTNGFYNCQISNTDFVYQTGVWYHVAGTYDGSFIRYYINGCLYKQIPASGTIVVHDSTAAIGTRFNNVTGEHFRGNIDEVRIWNVARTQSEILHNMNDLPTPASQTGLLAYYKFSNDYLNVQGNTSWNGNAIGTPGFDVEAPILPVLTIQNVATVDATCFGFTDGALTISATGQNITYSLDGVNFQTDSTFTGLSGGPITVYIKNLYGCIESIVDTIQQPNQVPTPVINTNTPLCTGDSLFLSADTLSGATCYWTGPNNYASQAFDTLFTNISNNLNGDYSVYFTYNGCNSDTATQNIFINPVYNINLDTTICSNETYTLGNQQLNQPGNYSMALQTVAGCDSIINLTLHVNPAYSFTRDTSICEGDIFIYQGQTLNATGTYPFYLQTILGCDSTITYNLIVYPIPPAPILTNNSPLICPGDFYYMTAQPVDSGTFTWWGPGNFSSTQDSISFSGQIEDMGIYYSTVTVHGCESPSSQIPLSIINIFTFEDFEFPNVITVNGDGTNDKLDLDAYFQTCQKYRMYIYNRWGNLIYEHGNNDIPFQGITKDNKDAEDGVYTYRLVYEDGVKSGFFHLIR